MSAEAGDSVFVDGVFTQTKEQFFEAQLAQGTALTYDDVRIANWEDISQFAVDEVDTTTQFTRNVDMRVPFVSAAMDTVTTSSMAIAMAELGGIGVIHAGLSIDQQKKEVRRVKHHRNGLIERPITFTGDATLEHILGVCDEKDYDFRTFPITDNEGKLLGVLTTNDFELSPDKSRSAEEVMTPREDLLVGDEGTDVEQAYKLMISAQKKTLPLVDEGGKVAGLYVFSDVHRRVSGDSDGYNMDAERRLRVAAALPTREEEALERIDAMRHYLEVVVLDSAHGDSKFALNTLRAIKNAYPDGLDVMVGNISSGHTARILAENGADGIKVGQGPGTICTTRAETGIGTPQVTAVYICMRAVEKYGIPVCADGGITNNGDISVAIAAGAHSVMMGGMLAGTDEAPGEVIQQENGIKVKKYRGMGSAAALRASAAARERYGARKDGEMPLPEGIEALVPYKGSVNSVLGRANQALRKSMSYVGSGSIDDHRKDAPLMRITNAGLRESHPHDVTVLR